MKRVKIMLSAILVMAIVAGALAFKVKSNDVCAYATVDTSNPPATSLCVRTHDADETADNVRFTSSGAVASQFAITIPIAGSGDPCPATTVECNGSNKLTTEN